MYKDFFLGSFNVLLMVVLLLLGVGFFTLLERKVLGYVQIRKGPNKLGFIGVFQPFGDGIKLFLKEQVHPLMSNFNLFYVCPMFNLFISLLLWLCIPYMSVLLNFNLGVLFFLCCLSIAVYSVMLAAWSSNSSYALLGGVRLIAQVISYEVSFFLIFLSFLFLILSLNFFDFGKYQDIWFLFLCLFLCVSWLVSSLAETNRSPFDFSEGESELVSGFNVEFSGMSFMFIFLSEYLNILFMSMVCTLIFLGGNISDFFFFLKAGFVIFYWIWVRGTLPRYRYDKLMYLCWKSYLPLSLNYLFFYISLKLFVFSFLI